MKRSSFQAVVISILLYGCTTWTLTKWQEKKLDGNYTRMLRAILNKSWRQHPTKHQLYSHLPPIKKTIQVRRTTHAGHCWRCRDKLINDVPQWTPTYGRAKAGRPARTYIQQLCEDMGCSHRRWMIGRSGESGSGISVLMARHDDDECQINWELFFLVKILYSEEDYMEWDINTLSFKQKGKFWIISFKTICLDLLFFPNVQSSTYSWPCWEWRSDPVCVTIYEIKEDFLHCQWSLEYTS